MAEQWRIFVVVDDENLNRNIVSSLRKDGYLVNGATSGRDAVRILWAEVHDIVICDLNTPGADGFELLQWLRAYRANTRVILVGAPIASLRTQALEEGAVGYLEKPLDLHLLKEELRRLLVQTGFSADLDSFDLLDVIQIISASRRNIALLVNTGLEERGMLCFQQGTLVWAEYGTLRGEEAFFALAAHKNGTVIHQPWNQHVTPNVTQPLSRLILQAFQYRTKYSQMQQQLSGEQNALPPSPAEDEDAPFLVLTEHVTEEPQEAFPIRTDAFASMTPAPQGSGPGEREGTQLTTQGEKEWWQPTGKFSGVTLRPAANGVPATPVLKHSSEEENILSPAALEKTTVALNNGEGPESSVEQEPGHSSELPSWLTDQSTASSMPVMRPVSPPTIPTRNFRPSSPVTPAIATAAEWQLAQTKPPLRTPRKLVEQRVKEMTGPQKSLKADTGTRRTASPEWQLPDDDKQPQSGPLQNPDASDLTLPLQRNHISNGVDVHNNTSSVDLEVLQGTSNGTKKHYNYTSLVSAMQTLGYSINGFVAAAVVSSDGRPIAQVAVDDLDISPMCKHLAMVMQSALQVSNNGEYEHLVITSTEGHVILRAIGGGRRAFQVLVTTRAANPAECSVVMANVEGAITAALR